MYSAGDYVVCRDMGVCKVVKMQENTPSTILVSPCMPAKTFHGVDPSSVVRRAMSLIEAQDVVQRIPYLQTIRASTEKAYRELLVLSFETYDALEWVKIIKSSYVRNQHGQMHAWERPYAGKAKEYLHCDLAQALSISYEEVEPYIQRQIEEELL